ncbi:hypothetical protein [Cupriavidus pinatubonensis]|uniref:Uncharacterized protein n=1 Tax=Cupriavidus pinatubonensis TaxID=248026 RepID=A0ABM8WL58_9BURK|nr:hypothetical protein [Cupriavidus pinatubonensis]CAG9168119.1 hypothetical protein LMG23994_01312 [Cupriavidus pinatubonensis]
MRANTLACSEPLNTLSIIRSHIVAAPAHQDPVSRRAGPVDIGAAVARFSVERLTLLREILISITQADAADGSSDGSAGAVAQIAMRRAIEGIEESTDYLAFLSDSHDCEIDTCDAIDLAVTRFSAIRAMLEATRLQGCREVAELAAAGVVLAAGGLERAHAGRTAIAPLGLVA